MTGATASVRLSTWQDREFPLVERRVEWDKSKNWHLVPEIPGAYRRLAHLLGTNQIIWCYLDRAERHRYQRTGVDTDVEWVLTVPSTAILAYYDEAVWHRLIGRNVVFEKWREDAFRSYPGSRRGQDEYIRCCEASYDLPEEELWNRLIVRSTDDVILGALLRHPVDQRWIHDAVPIDPNQWPT